MVMILQFYGDGRFKSILQEALFQSFHVMESRGRSYIFLLFAGYSHCAFAFIRAY